MTKTQSSQPTIPLQCLLLGLEEIIGPEELSAISKAEAAKIEGKDDFFKTINPIQQRLLDSYGTMGLRGLAMCSGRAAFKHLLAEQGKELGFEEEGFLFSPARLKLARGLNSLAAWLKREIGISLTIKKKESTWECRINGNQEEKSLAGMCDFLAGLLQAFMAWAGGGRFYQVRETECRSRGADFCLFVIDRFPLD